MAYIKTLKDNELIGGQDNTDVYPISTTQAIFSQNQDGSVPSGIKHQKLEDRLQDNEADAKELHRKTEKLVVYLTNDKAGQTLEITGDANAMVLSGNANVESYGDEPATPILPANMTVKSLSVIFSSASTSVAGEAQGYNWVGTYTIPNVVGQYTAKFDCTYNGIAKSATSVTNINLRKYFGFATNTPTDVTTLGTSHFSNSVGCTVTVPASGNGFKRIFFAVPSQMTITEVTQPDALNAPLAISQVGTVNRTIGGNTYSYKLYQSNDLIDSSVAKRLTIK